MTTKLHITSIEGCTEAGELVFTLKKFDAGAVEVNIEQNLHNETTWRELAEDIGRAIKMMELEGPV